MGLWLTNPTLLRALLERLAKQAFAARKNPSDAALYYLAVGKRSALVVRPRSAA